MFEETPAIHRLPVETLTHVFRYLVQEEPVAKLDRLPPALILRSVCRHWNAVAEATPELWVQIIGPYGLRWTCRALLLSKNTPLDLTIVDRTSEDRGFKDVHFALPLLKNERHRIRKLKIHFGEFLDDSQCDIEALFSLPLPMLEELDLEDETPFDYILDENALSGEIPANLKLLRVYSYTGVLSNSLLLRAPLTTLTIEDSPTWLSMDEVLATLSVLPQLENFTWKVFVMTYNEDLIFEPLPLSASSEPSSVLIHLPCLRTIDILAQIELIAYLMTRTVLPSSCNIIVHADMDNIPEGPVDEVWVALDHAFGNRLRTAFPEDTGCNGFRTFKMQSYMEDMASGATLSWKDPTSTTGPESFTLGFLPWWEGEAPHIHEAAIFIISHILSHWPATCRAISHFCIEHHGLILPDNEVGDPESQPWTRILRLVPSVQSIEVNCTHRGIHISGLIDSLSIRSPDSVLPNLQRVDVRDTDITLADFTNFLNVLNSRRSACAPHPPKLWLLGCTLDGQEIPDVCAKSREN